MTFKHNLACDAGHNFVFNPRIMNNNLSCPMCSTSPPNLQIRLGYKWYRVKVFGTDLPGRYKVSPINLTWQVIFDQAYLEVEGVISGYCILKDEY